jgi:uncharacterized protein YxeA
MKHALIILLTVCVAFLYACETIETRQPDQRAKLEQIEETNGDGARLGGNNAYQVYYVTGYSSTTTSAQMAIGQNEDLGSLFTDSLMKLHKANFAFFSVKTEKNNVYLKRTVDKTKPQYWYIKLLVKPYRWERKLTVPANQPTFSFLPNYMSGYAYLNLFGAQYRPLE